MEFIINGLIVKLVQGDITDLDADAITNAANSQLVMGAGVAGAIYRKGGHGIQIECNQIGRCEVGKAVITGGGKLKANHVIHAVGPRMGEGNEHAKLRSAVASVLNLAEQSHLGSVAVPAISTGVFGFPVNDAAKIMAKVILDYSFEQRDHLHTVIVCLYDSASYDVFHKAFQNQLEEIDEESKTSTLLIDKD